MNGKTTPKARLFTDGRLPARHEIQVWQVSLDVSSKMIGSLMELLTAAEREQASRFHFTRDRRRFIIRRAALRQLLANALDASPQTIHLETGRYGKPVVMGEAGSEPLKFNCSHSGDRALIAISRDIELGVDLEQHQDLPDAENLAGAFFSDRENQELSELSPSLKMNGFFNCWTRKEAFVKATGMGLAYPLKNISVSLSPDKPAAIVEMVDDPAAVTRWTMVALAAGPEYSAALVFEGKTADVKMLGWSSWSDQAARE